MSLSRSRAVAVTSAGALLLALLGAAPAAAAPRPPAPTGDAPVLVASGPYTPLHLAASPNGRSLYLAGDDSVVRIDLGATPRTVTLAEVGGFVPGVAVQGQRVIVVASTGDDPEGPPTATFLGHLDSRGDIVRDADVLWAEEELNPDEQVPDADATSNPYDVVAYRGGFIVADAGANALWRVSASGKVSVLTKLPISTAGPCADGAGAGDNNGTLVGCDPVPTGVVLGPDGYLYVSGLGSFVAGQVWKVDPRSGAIVQTLTATLPEAPPLTDIAVADDGTLYVSSIVADGVFRLRDGEISVVEIAAPAGLLWVDGTLYVGSAPGAFDPSAPGAVYAVPDGAFEPIED